MLIRLQPAIPLPTVLFAVNFPNLPDHLSTSPSWAAQLSSLSNDDLEIPDAFHALDSAVKIPSIVEEVSFDIPLLSVSCRFIDGMTEEWPLLGDGFLRALQSVLDDVTESALETERERQREKERQRLSAQPPPAPAVVALPAKVGKAKHRKQRSMIFSFMANLVTPSSSSSSVSPPSPDTLEPVVEEQVIPPPPPASLSPRSLRRRARSTLVDTFRQYVQREINQRLPTGGYYTWVATSMLRRATGRMAQIAEQVGEAAPGLLIQHAKHTYDENSYFCNTPGVLYSSVHSSSIHSSDDVEVEELKELEDMTDTDTISTDTDGSSLHTPSSSMFTPSPRTTLYQDDDSLLDIKSSQATGLSTESCIAYNAYSSMAQRLQQLILVANARAAHFDNEIKARDSILEIRSRRRAWLNKCLAGSGFKDFGLATPFKSSLLGTHYWSAADVEDKLFLEEPAEHVEEVQWDAADIIFPASDDEDDEQSDEDCFDHDMDIDGLSGTSWHRENAPSSSSQRPSMRRNPARQKRSIPANASALLCQPLARLSLAGDKPPVYTELDPEEFTLSMDVPFKSRAPGWPLGQKRVGRQLRIVPDEQPWFSQLEFSHGPSVEVGGS